MRAPGRGSSAPEDGGHIPTSMERAVGFSQTRGVPLAANGAARHIGGVARQRPGRDSSIVSEMIQIIHRLNPVS